MAKDSLDESERSLFDHRSANHNPQESGYLTSRGLLLKWVSGSMLILLLLNAMTLYKVMLEASRGPAHHCNISSAPKADVFALSDRTGAVPYCRPKPPNHTFWYMVKTLCSSDTASSFSK